jgi:prepilin-type N-terminal cleavage/methylation domain-containing protein
MIRRGVSKRRGPSGESGFTLIELMLVVLLISILALIAVPNFMKLVYKSRRAEAYWVLKSIHADQTGYFTEAGMYADAFGELGFTYPQGQLIDDQTIEGPYYTYTISALDQGGTERANFRVTATGNIDPSDPILDILIIENDLTVFD